MYERILVPLDGSELAESALPHAEVLASHLGAEVLLLRAVPTGGQVLRETATPIATEYSLDVASERHSAEAEAAARYLAAVQSRLEASGARVRTLVAEGDATGAVVRTADQEQASLICMATRGRGGISRLLLGSVADGVLRRTEVPVLLIRPDAE